jgi:RNA polymerase sigma factor (TIGR02999 family)
MTDVTRILNAIERGDAKAADELLPLVYEELRLLAAQRLSREPPGQTLQATALVHEAYLRLVGDEPQSWDNRGHFFAAAAEAMRRILIDNARRKKSARHGGHGHRLDLSQVEPGTEEVFDDLLVVDEALQKLAATDGPKAELVKLRYFAGLTLEQAGEVLGMSRSSAYENWAYARAWLRAEITKGEETPPRQAGSA